MAKVQFIGYQIQTAATGDPKRQEYPGLQDQRNDIEARCKVLADAIECASKSPRLDHGALKIFVAPEFFFRGGAGGVYDITNISYISELMDEWLSKDTYKSWIFVMGTALAVMPGGPKKEIVNAAVVRRGGIAVTKTDVSEKDSLVVYKEYVSAVDFFGQHFAKVKQFLYDDATAGKAHIQGSEQTLAPTSGARPTKKVASPDGANIHGENRVWTPSDKLKARYNQLVATGKMKPEDRDRLSAPVPYQISEKSASGLGGGTNFTMAGLELVLELCLDHMQHRAESTVDWQDIDIHLVSSCGMQPQYYHMKTNGCFFLVDGGAHDERCIYLAKDTAGKVAVIPKAATISMTDSRNWKYQLGSATRLFQAGRGTVYIFPKQDLP